MIRILRAEALKPEDFKSPEIERDNAVERAVDEIIASVRKEGDAALVKYAQKFDGAAPDAILVPRAEIDAAYARMDPEYIRMLQRARANIEDFHRRQIRQSFVVSERPGITLGQRVIPLEKVGLYVPGGTACYPSSVLMNAVPARLAGVGELIIATPPGKDGEINPQILAAAKVCAVDTVVRCGGAQAIAALAYGTQSVPRVDKIVGPGNVYVATAKRRVFGQVDIDMIAGPSEILIVADGQSNPSHIAADLLSQAEHDKNASAILLTDSQALAVAVQAEIERQLAALERNPIARASIDDNGRIILVANVRQAIDIANTIAPEHLELMLDEPFQFLGMVKSAGSVFLGRHTPEALGDYFAGPNHTLPTSGTARFSSPLSVDDFVKKSQFVCYTKDALRTVKDDVMWFAASEGLTAHANSVGIRFEGGDEE